MLTGGEKPAGLLVPLTADGIDEDMLLSHALALTDPALRNELGQGARERFNSEFEIGMMLDRYKKLYDRRT